MSFLRLLLCATLLGLLATGARADDVYFSLPVADLKIVEGELPAPPARGFGRWGDPGTPRVALDGPGEGFIAEPRWDRWVNRDAAAAMTIAIRTPQPAGVVRGVLVLPNAEGRGSVAVRFEIPAEKASPEARAAFLEFKRDHYQRLVSAGVPGAAYFRHQARSAQAELGAAPEAPDGAPAWDAEMGGDPDRAQYELFSGSRAVRENLQLDRLLRPRAGDGARTVDIATLKGITIAEMKWERLLSKDAPAAALDPLASAIPADQHAVFFPSFDALAALSDDLNNRASVVSSMLPIAGDSTRGVRFYERQLCLGVSGLSRLLGPQMISSVAVTGSDPYFPSGTDVAVIFQAHDAGVLRGLLQVQITLAAQAAGAPADTPPEGLTGGVTGIVGFRTPDRSVCSYLAMVGDLVIVTNSPQQIGRIAAARQGGIPALSTLDEYRFFRERYRRGAEGESALILLSDATIRRWCSARWRIGEARRIAAGAVMADIQAANASRLIAGGVSEGPVKSDAAIELTGELTLTPGGVRSSVFGTLDFMTPLAELPIDKVTAAEAEAYTQWRDGYQRNWRWAFDPIALRLSAGKGRLAADLTVMPLIAATDYQLLIQLCKDAAIAPAACDPHDALLQIVMAINRDSVPARMGMGFVSQMAPDLKVDPLGWLGQAVSVYIDDDALWDELAGAGEDDPLVRLDDQLFRIPLGLHAQVESPLKLTAFLAAARAYVDQAAPGMLSWETKDHNGQAYVRVRISQEQARGEGGGAGDQDQGFCYAATGDALIVALREDVLSRALDRRAARAAAKKAGTERAEPDPWLGESLAWRAGPQAARLLGVLNPSGSMVQQRGWRNIAILNEWRRLFPDRDPVAVHAQLWGETLTCDAGGTYAWNPDLHTMESTAVGSPDAPRRAPALPGLAGLGALDMGLTFEEHGLRARLVLNPAQAK